MKQYFKHIISVVALSLATVFAVAQQSKSVEFAAKNFQNDKKGLKEALKNLANAEAYYEEGDFIKTLEFGLEAQKFNPNNAELNYLIGSSYFSLGKYKDAIPYFEKTLDLDRIGAGYAYSALGQAYQKTYQFDDAIIAYQKAIARLTTSEKKEFGSDYTQAINECNNGKEFMEDTVRAFIDNMGTNINSTYHDYAPVVTADQSMLLFTSTRPNQYTTEPRGDGEFDENIYYSYRNETTWSPAMEIGEPLNTKENDATIGLSADGQRMFTYYGKKGGDIKYSERKGEKWTTPTMFSAINSPNGHESSASFSPDGKTVYFTSNNTERVKNYGKHDVFMCKMNENGKWGRPINLGDVINTPYDEVGAFMHPDGRTLYFASDGHKTMGGYDIFRSTLQDDGTWTVPENLGYPINTPEDDMYFVMGGSGKQGYLSSSREGSIGGLDIYKVTILGPEKKLNMTTENNLIAAKTNAISQEVVLEKSVEIKTSRLTVVKGVVSDAFADPIKYLDATIEITDNATGEILFSNISNSVTGKFLIPLPSGKNYGLAVKKDGYLFHSENFDVPQTTDYQEITLDVKLMPIVKDAKIVLRNVFFDTDKSNLNAMSYAELNNLIKIMEQNPKIKIEIGGHTDNVGSKAYNQRLSQARAESVVNYLLSKNVSADRMTFKGYAFDEPIDTNDTPEGRAQNRRVEFKIVSNE